MAKYSKKDKPIINYLIIAECPDWNELGYQVCTCSSSGYFSYPDQPNDMFHDYVIGWDYLTDQYGEKILYI